MEIKFIDHFNTQLVITLNYSVITNIRTLQITRVHAAFPACSVFISSCLVRAPTVALLQLPCTSPL
jgi:hypothetical protein